MFEIDNPFSMVVLIVLISVGAGVINNYFKLRASRSSDAAAEDDIARMQSDIDRLAERVRVLEKIVTDKDKVLADEISRLA